MLYQNLARRPALSQSWANVTAQLGSTTLYVNRGGAADGL